MKYELPIVILVEFFILISCVDGINIKTLNYNSKSTLAPSVFLADKVDLTF